MGIYIEKEREETRIHHPSPSVRKVLVPVVIQRKVLGQDRDVKVLDTTSLRITRDGVLPSKNKNLVTV